MEEVRVIPRRRKGKVLTPSQFGCLRGIPTLNVTNGCLFRCTYCYARGYSRAPVGNEVDLYHNLPDLLKAELLIKRRKTQWVILNTSSDCFQTHPDIVQVTYDVIEILLGQGIGISFLTKGKIPLKFMHLFKRSADKVLAQIGLVSLSDRYWKRYEPDTPSPESRLDNIKQLRAIGIVPEVRIDPIIPFITDTVSEIDPLLRRIGEAGAERVTLSYLHLRPSIERQLAAELSPLHRKLIESCFASQAWQVVGSSSRAKLLPRSLRERGYQRISSLAQQYGISASICQCKNPDLAGSLCGASRVAIALKRSTPSQLPLFLC